MSEFLLNNWFKIKSYFRFLFGYKPNLSKPINSQEYDLFFFDYFNNTILDENKWNIGQRWGDFHPDNLYEYFGKTDEFVYVKNGCLNLIAKYKPKEFYDSIKQKNIIIPRGKGLVVSKESFKYGFYEINAILPKGQFLWPAVWLTAVKTWPPEIDIFEAYSGKKSNYENNLGIKNFKIQPNLHFGFVEDGTKDSYGVKSFPIPNDPTIRPVSFWLHWTFDFIKIYYDGYLVFKTEKKEILDYYNKEDVTMNIILNNGFQPEIGKTVNETSNFRINCVKFYKKK